MQNSPGPNNFSLDKLQNIVLTKCGSFFKKLQGQWTLSLHVYKNTYLFHIIFASMHRLVWCHRLRHEALSTCNVTQRITTGHPSRCLLEMRFYFWLISFKPKFKRQIVFVEIYLKQKNGNARWHGAARSGNITSLSRKIRYKFKICSRLQIICQQLSLYLCVNVILYKLSNSCASDGN